MLQNGYGIMPNAVLFDKELSATSKLLFVLISSLCAERGYCWANNKYLGDALGISERQVSRSIKQLDRYMNISNPYNERRQISLDKNVQAPRQKRLTSLDKNVAHNITKKTTKIKGSSYQDYLDRYYPMKAEMMPDLSAR